MKNYAKVGGKNGKPAYRTPSTFKIRQCQKVDNRRLKEDGFKSSSFRQNTKNK